MIYIKKLSNLSNKDVLIAGGKGASLGELMRANISVPNGFVVLTTAFEKFLDDTDLRQEILAQLNKAKQNKIHTIEQASRLIQSLILNAEIPKDIAEVIVKNYSTLNTKYVAVRSSATAEDSSSDAWAGQLETYLNTTEKTLLENIKKCWASLFTPRAIFYRLEKGLKENNVSVAVVVQEMIESEKAGIAFSVHPVTQDKNQMIIEAGFGLGEAIVSGEITPDAYVVSKKDDEIVDININKQTKALYKKDSGGNEWIELGDKGEKQVLNEKEILELAKIIKKIEKHYTTPQDIEWAFANGKFYITQSRPITTLELSQLLDKAKKEEKFIIPRTREHCLSPVYWNPVLHTSKFVEKNYGKKFSIVYNFFSNGKMNAVIPKDEWQEIGNYITKNLISREKYFNSLEKKTEKAKQKIIYFLADIKKKNLSEYSFYNLIDIIDEIYNLFINYDSASVFAWFVAGDTLKQKIKKILKIESKDLDIITLPKKQTFTTQMERKILEISLKKTVTKKNLKNLFDKYYWIPFGYDGPTIWDETTFKEHIDKYKKNIKTTKAKLDKMIKMEEELRQKSKKILKKLKLNNKEKKLIHILQTITIWTDERKMLEFQLFFWYHQILKEFEKRYNFPILNLKYLFIDEIKKLNKKTNTLKKITKQRIKQEFMTISTDGNIRIATNQEMQKIKKIIKKHIKKGDLRGNVACRGPKTKYIARVKVLNSSKECKKIKEGEILVATMTTPDYVPAMNRALGFITDEGGITCHAAIVSRELGKPCIIGTKTASQILKDGDLIEINTNTGIIKIIKK